MIDEGYCLVPRAAKYWQLANAPPHVREIWAWLVINANHKDSQGIKRGQCVRSLADIIAGLVWFIGYRRMAYTKSKCEFALEWLRKHEMIETKKTTRGLLITICKYDYYQDPKNYQTPAKETSKGTRNQQPTSTINNNALKNENKEEELKIPIGFEKPIEDWKEYLNLRKIPFSNFTLTKFIDELLRVSNEVPSEAQKFVDQAITHNHNGLYPLKNEKNEKSRTYSKQEAGNDLIAQFNDIAFAEPHGEPKGLLR